MNIATIGVTLLHQGEKPVGVCLGYSKKSPDHEQGIWKIAKNFGFRQGASSDINPIECASAKKIPAVLDFYRVGEVSYLASGDKKISVNEMERYFAKYPTNDFEYQLRTAWNHEGFCISTKNDYGFLKKLYKAIQEKDVLIFEREKDKRNHGLCIVIKSFASEDYLEALIRDE
jgi:hypothetical protein